MADETKKEESIEKNEFENMSEEAPEQTFSDVEAGEDKLENGDVDLNPKDMAQNAFIKNPIVGESIVLEVEKVVKSDKTEGKNNATGETFVIGLKKKNGIIIRNDIVTAEGRYTISSWEVFYHLFGVTGKLNEYAKLYNTFKGAKLKITKNYMGNYANMKPDMIAKLLDKSLEEADKYREEVVTAMKEKRLYTIELLN